MSLPIPIHARTFLFLVPFAVMLAVHRVLGLADNLLAAPEPGKPDGAAYNLIMVFALWAGVVGFFVHMLRHANESGFWVLVKLALLATTFAVMAYFAECPGK